MADKELARRQRTLEADAWTVKAQQRIRGSGRVKALQDASALHVHKSCWTCSGGGI